MLSNIFLKTLRDQRRSLLWWALGFAVLVVYVLAVYPSMRDNPQLNDLLASYPESLKAALLGSETDMTSGPGYLTSGLFSLMLPLLMVIYAVGQGANAIAGEEERKTIDLLLAHPISRTRLIIEKLLALLAGLAVLGLVTWIVLWIGAQQVKMAIPAGNLAAATVSTLLMALVFGTIAFLLGAWTGRRSLSVGVTAALGVAAYLVNSQASRVEALKPLQKLSPFYYTLDGSPVRNGLVTGHVIALVVPILLLATVALVVFNRRDVAV